MSPQTQPDIYYRALLTKDRRFDGRIFFAVVTTGIYCRPICPARTPLRKNVTFFASAAAAEEAGFRPCLRCRPETSPGTPAWIGPSTTVSRALRLIAGGIVEQEGIPGLSERVGVGERQLRRLFFEHIGAPPQAVVRTRRLDFARKLIDETDLSISQIAFASGFGSIRRFNDAFKLRFQRNPADVRKGRKPTTAGSPHLTLKLPYRPPLDWQSLLAFLRDRAIPGVESVADDTYYRTFALGGSAGWFSVRPSPADPALALTVQGCTPDYLMEVVGRVRGLFDLEADPLTIAEQLTQDPRLGPLLREHPGLRVPGTWDGFELGVRAVLGQQVSVRGARTLAERLAGACGSEIAVEGHPSLRYIFPSPSQVAATDLAKIGIPRTRAQTIKRFAELVQSGELKLDASADPEGTVARLLAIPGIGPWTAEYIAMRALRHPDAFPASDLVIGRELERMGLKTAPEAWRPWRAYAAMCLWKGFAARQATERKKSNVQTR